MSSKRISQSDRKNIKSIRKAVRTASSGAYNLANPDAGTYTLRESSKNLSSVKHSAKAGR